MPNYPVNNVASRKMKTNKTRPTILFVAAVSLLLIDTWSVYSFFRTFIFYFHILIGCGSSGGIFCNGSKIGTLLNAILYLLLGVFFLALGISLIKTLIGILHKGTAAKQWFFIYSI